MGKRLASIIAALAMLAPVAASALGLGNIVMNSALNQPLDAEIELLSVQKADLADLRVSLGSPEDFARVGAERAYFLTKIKFKVAQKPDGSSFVKLSSTEFVTEPFLDFVVEARWPRGRILREFTVLVDPPVLSQESPAPIQQASTQPAPRAAAVTRQPPIRERADLSPVVSRDGVLSYGPVRPNDTLWVIANKMRPDPSITVNQMMAALVLNNPQAFYNGNVNQLKAGYVLRIDDPASITALSVAQADAEIERQRAEWNARKSGQPMRQVASADAASAAAGDAGSAGGGADRARLKLVAPGSEGSGSGTGDADVDQLRQDLVLAAEALDANRQETEDLKARLAQMEEQLVAMQRLIMLKDNEMLGLQTQLGAEPGEEQPSEGEAAQEPAVDAAQKLAVGEAEPAVEVTEPAEEMPADEETAAPVPAPVVVADEQMPEAGLLDGPLLLYGGIGVLVLAIAGWFMARRRKMQEGFEESILNVGGDNAAAGSSEMAQGPEGESSLVSDFAMSEISDISGIQADSSEVDPLSEADVYLAYGRHQQAEDIIRAAIEEAPDRNELKLKLLEVLFAAKNSAGFESQAQELHNALGDETDPMWAEVVTMGAQLCPGNALFGGGAPAAPQDEFDSTDLDSAAADGTDDLLDFDFDLDSPDLGEAEIKDDKIAGEDVDTNFEFDADLGTDALETEADVTVSEQAPPADDNSLDFDVSTLDFNLNQGDAQTESDDSAVIADESLDFEMSTLDESGSTDDTDADKPALEDTEIAEAPDFSGLDIEDTDVVEEDSAGIDTINIDETDLELSAESSDVEESLEFDATDVEGELTDKGDVEFELDASDLDLGEEAAIEFDAGTEEGLEAELELSVDDELTVEQGDVSADADAVESQSLDAGGAETAEVELDEDLLDEDIFGEVDEIGTKLDLAKAYVDMGDGDGARSIIDEVLEEGDEAQQQQAKDLLGQIS